MNETQKLDRFLAAIYADGEAALLACTEEIQRKRAEALKQAEHDALEASYEYVRTEVGRIRAEHGNRVSEKVFVCRQALASRQHERMQALFSDVKKQLLAFSQGPEYPNALEKIWAEMKPALGDGEITLFLRETDLPLARKLFPDVTIAAGDIQLGGLIGQSANRRVDASYDTALREAGNRFAEEVSL